MPRSTQEPLLIGGADALSAKRSGCLTNAGRGCSGAAGASEAAVNAGQDSWLPATLISSVIFPQLSCFV